MLFCPGAQRTAEDPPARQRTAITPGPARWRPHPRSYAIGGPRAPACGVLEEGGQLGAGSDDSGAGGEAAGARLGEDGWKGITRDNNGRTAYWIALLYASLE